ncbi:MAG: YceD family protein [Solirubrobacteraceae bacterium]
MAPYAAQLDLAGLRLTPGEGRRLELMVPIEALTLSGEPYEARPSTVPVVLEVSRMTGGGYALRLRFAAALSGACMRCLKPAEPPIEVEAREIDRPGEGEELQSPYVSDEQLDLAAWAHDAFALAAPAKVLCREDCAGLCPICAEDLNEAGPDHRHEAAPDPRWEKLRELKLE